MSGSLLLWMANPPLEWGWLGWFALLPWLELIARPRLTGRRPYLTIWLAGSAFWLAALHWMTVLHWAVLPGWIAMSAYLGFYLPGWIAASRWAVHRGRFPLLLVAPLIWTALEFARAHLLTGFTFCSLAYTQYRAPIVIQISDLGGFYTLSLAMVLVAALVREAYSRTGRQRGFRVAGAAAIVGAIISYGSWRLSEPTTLGPRIALIQGNVPIDMKHDPRERERIFHEYFRLSQRAVTDRPDIELIVWPETMFRDPLVVVDAESQPPAEEGLTLDALRQIDSSSRRLLGEVALRLGKPLLIGIDAHHCRAGWLEHYNSAVMVSSRGELEARYDKLHLVLFGEYIPLGERLPFLYGLTPLAGGCRAGERPGRFELSRAAGANAIVAPSICFESVLPHIARQQVRYAEPTGSGPAILVNLTNNGWYHDLAELEMHLACGVFRAVELRRTFVTAANTGISAWIDPAGRIRAAGPSGGEAVVVAETAQESTRCLYLRAGDWLAWLCTAVSIGLCGISGTRARAMHPSPVGQAT